MSSMNWYLRRLWLMSPAEVWHRARVMARRLLDWRRAQFHQPRLPVTSFVRLKQETLHQTIARRPAASFFSLLPETPIPRAISLDDAIAMADDLLAHRFSFFELKQQHFGEVIQWNYNYRDHKICPLSYAPMINYRDERLVGDVKYIWELNRHQHLVPLAKAYYLTGDERYAREIVVQILSWIQQCPYMRGINWTSAEQAALRIISWVWAFEWIRSAASVTEAFIESFLRSLYQHLDFISQRYSRFSSANNHLISEATGVFVGTVSFPQLAHADEWRSASYEILVREALRQNHDDGVNCEQSTAYHCLVLEYLLLAGLLGEQHGIPFPGAYWRRLERMMEVIAAFMNCRGRLPDLGDDDNGAVIVLGPPPASRARSILATGAMLWEREDFRALAPGFDERTFWLLGADHRRRRQDATAFIDQTSNVLPGPGYRWPAAGSPAADVLPAGREDFPALAPQADARALGLRAPEAAPARRSPAACVNQASRAFPSGYYVLRSGSSAKDEVLAVFDCAPLGFAPLAAHGHADALHFTLSVAGRDMLVDPGAYAYHSQQKWRDYFRGTSAHNTIRVDEQDQSVIAGNFMWSHKAEAVLERWETSASYDLVRGYHTGYLRLADPVRHRREMVYGKEERIFYIVDTIEAQREHLIEQFFHFSEACEVCWDGREWLIENEGVQLRLRADEHLQVSLIEGRDDPPLGWRSQRLGHKQPSPTLVGRMATAASCRLETVISIA